MEGPWRAQVLHGVDVEPSLTDGEAVEPLEGVDDPGHGAGLEPALPQGSDEGRQISLDELEGRLALRVAPGMELGEVVTVGGKGVLAQPALDAQVVEILGADGRPRVPNA